MERRLRSCFKAAHRRKKSAKRDPTKDPVHQHKGIDLEHASKKRKEKARSLYLYSHFILYNIIVLNQLCTRNYHSEFFVGRSENIQPVPCRTIRNMLFIFLLSLTFPFRSYVQKGRTATKGSLRATMLVPYYIALPQRGIEEQ